MERSFAPGRAAHLVPEDGAIMVHGLPAGARDGVSVTEEASITVTEVETVELIVIEAATCGWLRGLRVATTSDPGSYIAEAVHGERHRP